MTILDKPDGSPDIRRGVNPANAPGIAVFRIDYDLITNGQTINWRANIGAYNINEAQNYLRELFAPKVPNIKSVGMETRLDAISNELRNTIVEGSKRKPGRPKKA
jgi:hypothetical protein